ncbi:hypothetical protein DACRYDRAFT_101389 [Dacryopinax primogenitus]|uniref:DUF7721 domain-containing protein n=1 Tax=Dacryopinax primogenitus (strain DJM 731) TaxID=1858805 RepID=M5G0A3_DACPD|nr:uncharacterized protein DACRYDRAFT_101389 [Dacryopinax primogenitus]EJT99251.1 hypothetical protein DACRYDRAFT_101389 [Dacryopinax primogenitus]
MPHHNPHRQESGFDEEQLEQASRESVQDAYAPPLNVSSYDEQAQIRRAEQESLQDAYTTGYSRPQEFVSVGREGYQRPPEEYAGYGRDEYQGPPQGYGRGEGYGRPSEEREYGRRPPQSDNQMHYHAPPGRPPQETQFDNARYSAPPRPDDEYGRSQMPQQQEQEHHHRHHHQQQQQMGEYAGDGESYGGGEYRPPVNAPHVEEYERPRPPAGEGYGNGPERPHNVQHAPTGPISQHHGTAAEYYNNEPPQPRPQQETYHDAQDGQFSADVASVHPPKPHDGPSPPNLQNAANFASQHWQDGVQDQELFNAAAAQVAAQQGHSQPSDDDPPTPTIHPHAVNSSSTPTQMGQAAAMGALQHVMSGAGGGAGGSLTSLLGGLTGGGGVGAAISSLLGASGGGAPSAPQAGAPHPQGASTGPAQGGAPPAGSPAAPASPYEKLIAVAMMKASELFDKHGSGDPAAKQQGEPIQAAASTVMKLMTRYQSGGSGTGGQFQPGEIQGLFGSFMKAFF